MSPYISFAIGVLSFLVLMVMGIPVAFCFLLVGFVGIWLEVGIGAALSALGTSVWQWTTGESLLPIPLFVLMGTFAFYSGISRDLYISAYKWVGRVPGGLAVASTLASTAFAACTGSGYAGSATMAQIAYPELHTYNYDDRLATSCLCAGGSLGILIPPSVAFIVYGYLTQVSIGSLFIAGILPGLLMCGIFILLIVGLCVRNPGLGGGSVESFSWRERLSSLRGIWGMLVLFGLVIGGLYFGIFAPSEAGAIGAFGAFVIALVRRRLTLRGFLDALKESVVISATIFIMIIGAMVFAMFTTTCGFASEFASLLLGLPFPSYGILAIMLLVYFLGGMVIEVVPLMLLLMPIYFPIVKALGFDFVWFGVLIVILTQMGQLTPPVGMNAYIVQGVTRVPLTKIFSGNLWFVAAMAITLVILVAFPQISLFLPSLT